MQPNLPTSVVKSIRRRVDPDEYRAIRQLWIAHSIAEDAHDIPGLMATLTEDCVYTVANTGTHWHGKPGATKFYRQLLTARLQLGFDSLMNGRAPADVPPRPGSGPPSSPPGSAPPSGRGGGGGKVGKAAGAVLTVISVVQIVGTLWTGNVKDAAKLAEGILAHFSISKREARSNPKRG